MKILAVRHGETEFNTQKRIQGWLDSPLTGLGQKQAAEVAQVLRGRGAEVIFCSDLPRAQATAGVIAQVLQLPVVFSWLLRERFCDQYEGQDRLNIDWEQFDRASRQEHCLVESPEQLSARTGAFLETLRYYPVPLKTIIVVTHGQTMNGLCKYLDPGHQHCLFDNAQVCELDY